MKTDLDYLKEALEGINPNVSTWVTDTLKAIVDAAIELQNIEKVKEIEIAKEIAKVIGKVKGEKKSRFSKS